MMLMYQTDSSKNSINKRKPVRINIQQPNYIVKITKQGKSILYPTIGDMFGFDMVLQIITINQTKDIIHVFWMPITTSTLSRLQQLSDLENTVSELLAKGKITEKYMVDLFIQEALFESRKIELESKHAGKEIVICGGEIFVGEDMNKLIDEASRKYPQRPFYSYSLKNEYSTF